MKTPKSVQACKQADEAEINISEDIFDFLRVLVMFDLFLATLMIRRKITDL